MLERNKNTDEIKNLKQYTKTIILKYIYHNSLILQKNTNICIIHFGECFFSYLWNYKAKSSLIKKVRIKGVGEGIRKRQMIKTFIIYL